MSNKQQAELLYDNYLRSIQNRYGSAETNSQQLNRIGKSMFKSKFRGVFASDRIPQMVGGQYAIVNLDDSSKSGSHWVAVAKGNTKSYLYDSFGRKKYKILPKLLQSGNGIVLEPEHDAEQHIKEENCGQRCLAWLKVYQTHGWSSARHI